MPNTFTLINAVTVGSGGAANITFSSIPNTYTDLCLKISSRSAAASVNPGVVMKFNGVGTGYSSWILYGSGTSTSSYSDTSGESAAGAGNNATANTFGNGEIYIPNYAGSTNKSFSSDSVNENNATSSLLMLIAGLWSNTAAITSIVLTDGGSNNFLQYSTAYLYGIVKS